MARKRSRSTTRPLHLVWAWAAENRLVLGQEACAEKSNACLSLFKDRTAIPKLLELIEVAGAIVTIDAMGCQTEIAAKVVEKNADYVFCAKDNQPTLVAEISQAFDDAANAAATRGTKSRVKRYKTREKGHGRVKERTYYVIAASESVKRSGRWKKLTSLGMVERRRVVQGKEEVSVNYYIISFEVNVRKFARAVRGHWGIENRLHWMLDVEFAEDASRIRKGSSPQIASMLRQLALMVLQQDTSLKEKTIRGKRKMVGWSNEALDALLRSAQAL